MAQLRCKTLGDVSPRGKARVYFACHPEDHKGYFREIVGDLLKYSNCAVYYYDEEPEQDDEYYVNLERMQLIVIPVTTRLLYLPNRAMEVEFAYAMEHHIPVLPLMQEQGLEEKYAEKFGNLQFLDKGKRDVTAIPYEDKLKKYLNAVLLNDEQTAQIRAAFDAWIFLSYRKKDRNAAQRLMSLIHSDPRCRDIAIWYDEFLNPGEDFNHEIMKALQESDLFLLAVTPNLLEKGNYVMREEFPKARDAGKPILPAEMEQTDREVMQTDFPGVPDLLDPGVDGAVTGAVLDALSALALRKNDEDPKHNFFIGLAYLSGFFVEKDQRRAVELITEAAEAGLTEAVEKLVTMYETGEGVKRDYHTSIQWYEKLVDRERELCRQADMNHQTPYNILASRLFTLGDAYKSLGEVINAQKAYDEAYEVTRKRLEKWDAHHIRRDLSVCYLNYGQLCMMEGNYNEANLFFDKGIVVARDFEDQVISRNIRTDIVDTHILLARYYETLGDLYYHEGEYSNARKYYLQGVERREAILKYDVTNAQHDLARNYKNVGDVCLREDDLQGQITYYTKSLELNAKMAEAGDEYAKQNLFFDYDAQGKICCDQENYTAAKKWYLGALEIAEQTQEGTAEAEANLHRCYYMLGGITEKLGDEDGAKQWYMQSLRLAEKMARTDRPDDCEALAISYCFLGEIEQDVSLLEKSKEIFRSLAVRYPNEERYLQIASGLEETIREMIAET